MRDAAVVHGNFVQRILKVACNERLVHYSALDLEKESPHLFRIKGLNLTFRIDGKTLGGADCARTQTMHPMQGDEDAVLVRRYLLTPRCNLKASTLRIEYLD